MAKEPSVWAVALIDHRFIHNLFEDTIRKPKYRIVESYIPTIKVLKKQVKGKKFFEEVPLMLNYGFFKVPRYFVPNPHFLVEMKKDIRCIQNWLIDGLASKQRGRLGYEKLHNPLGVALARSNDISIIKEQEESKSIYTEKDLNTLYEGMVITLQCYPFEGIPAEIITIDRKRKRVEVELLIETPLSRQSTTWVHFENIFYTRYMEDYVPDQAMREKSLEEIRSKNKASKIFKDGDSPE